MDYKLLKGLVLQKYFSITAFADSIGWKRNKASRIVNGVQEPSIDDIIAITNDLRLDEKSFFAVFFANLSTMCTIAS